MTPEQIAQLLPSNFQRTLHEGSPMAALLKVMADLQAPTEALLLDASATFDPRRTRDDFVPYLASWVDLDWLFEPFLDERRPAGSMMPFPPGLGRLRELIAQSGPLLKRGGTISGLLLFLRTATGEMNFGIDEEVMATDGTLIPFHFRVRAPESVAVYRAFLQRLIEFEKPAHVTYELSFEGEPKADARNS